MRQLIKIISATVILATLFSLCSCGPLWTGGDKGYPEGYTGGHGITYGSDSEYYWVESYEECLDAIEKLKSHGSSFKDSIVFSYDGELFDTKYCFAFDGHKSEDIRYGEDPFDRWSENVYIVSYGFFEEVTIDELIFSYVTDYDVLYLSAENNFGEKINKEIISDEHFSFDRHETHLGYICYDGEYIAQLLRSKSHSALELTDECADAVLTSVELLFN